MVFALLFSALQVQAQNIEIRALKGGREGSYLFREPYLENHSPVLVSLNRHSVDFKNTLLNVDNIKSYGISTDHTLFSFISLKAGSLNLFTVETPGKQLIKIKSTGYQQDDSSLRIYVLNDGRSIVRSNVAHFDLYKQDGSLLNTISNISGSSGGEAVSKLAISPDGTFILAYNPKIIFKNSVQSRIQKINFNKGTINSFYYNDSMEIKDLRISQDGQFAVATLYHGSRSEVIIFDRFGNEIRKFSFHYVPDAVVLTKDDKYVTITYKNQLSVYDILNGRRVGSTSLRSYLFYGTYIPEDRMLLGFAGDYHSESGSINNIKIYGVDLKARKLGNGEYGETLKWDKQNFNLKVSRIRSHHYEIKGFSSPLILSAKF